VPSFSGSSNPGLCDPKDEGNTIPWNNENHSPNDFKQLSNSSTNSKIYDKQYLLLTHVDDLLCLQLHTTLWSFIWFIPLYIQTTHIAYAVLGQYRAKHKKRTMKETAASTGEQHHVIWYLKLRRFPCCTKGRRTTSITNWATCMVQQCFAISHIWTSKNKTKHTKTN
jgi:hypothetical protein